MLDPSKQKEPQDVAHLKSLQEQLHEQFKDYVSHVVADVLQQRMRLSFQGRSGQGMTALDLGLIDSLGTMHQVLVQKFGEDYRLVTIQAKSGLSLMSAFPHLGKQLSVIQPLKSSRQLTKKPGGLGLVYKRKMK